VEVNVEKLYWEFNDVSFKPGECIEEVVMRISTIANQLRLFGDDISDEKVVKKMLQSMPEHLEQVVISMETLLDLYTLLIEEAAGHLQAVENHKKKKVACPGKNVSRQSLLTEEQWKRRAKASSCKKSGGRGNDGSRGHSRGHGGRRGGGA
jgi:hypothetical protein